MASNAVLSFLNLLFYFRGIPSLASLVKMLIQIGADMASFALIMITLLCGFGCAFYCLFAHQPNHLEGRPFGTVFRSVYQGFKIGIIGDCKLTYSANGHTSLYSLS